MGDDDQSNPPSPSEEKVLRVGESKISSQKSTPRPRCTLRKGSQLHDFPMLETLPEPGDEVREAEVRGERDGKAIFDSVVQPRLRQTQPVVKAYARGSQQQVVAAEQDDVQGCAGRVPKRQVRQLQ